MAENTTAAAVDIGTNSVKLTVGRRCENGGVETLLDATSVTRLGSGVDKTGRLDPQAAHRTLDALADFARQAQEKGAARIAAVGTSALRDAGESGAAFVREAQQVLGGTVEVISGDREAALVYASARHDPDLPLPSDAGIVLATTDIGGGSTEVVLGRGDALLFRDSLQMGAVRLTERTLPPPHDPPTPEDLAHAAALADEILAAVPVPAGPAFVVASGGTAANLAAMALMAGPHPPPTITPDTLHGVHLTLPEIERRIDELAALPLVRRRETPGLEPARADVIVAGAVLQARALRRLGADALTVSARGLRYGLLYELLAAAAARS